MSVWCCVDWLGLLVMLVFAITLGIVALGCCVLAGCAGVFDVVFARVLSELWASCWYLVASELLA